jgi:plasmid stability protein
MEDEVRHILREAGKPAENTEGLGTRIAARFRGIGFKPGEIRELRGGPVRYARFDDK